jgi:predicted SAM-dependent methyltransferase
VNIDFVQTSATDFVCDTARLPYRDDEVDSIETYHMIEHLPRDKAAQAVHEWFRVLRAGGTLAMQCPDFDQQLDCICQTLSGTIRGGGRSQSPHRGHTAQHSVYPHLSSRGRDRLSCEASHRD